jgi:hypothetical protein
MERINLKLNELRNKKQREEKRRAEVALRDGKSGIKSQI